MTGFFNKFFMVVAALTICVNGGAQAQLQTKKFRLSEFTHKNTKIVLTGNEMNDALFREGVKKTWNISPYEFCNEEVFEKEKHDGSKFFLLISESTSFDEEGAGIYTLGIFQGSEKKNLYKVSSIPFCSTTDPDGREYVFLPLLLRALQNDIGAIMKNEFNVGNMVKVRSVRKNWEKNVYFSTEDLAESPGASSIAAFKTFHMFFVSPDEIEKMVKTSNGNALVGYTTAPEKGTDMGFCYKMIFDASNGNLYYFEKHMLSDKKGPGFQKSDLEKIRSHKQ